MGFLKSLFGLTDNSDLEGIMRSQQAEAKRANDLAISTQLKAQEQAAAALVSPADLEGTRLAGESLMRRRRRSTAPGPVAELGAAPVGYTMLTGA